MKRIANKVAVQSICYTVRGTDYVRIVDYPSTEALANDFSEDCSGGTVVFDDQLNGASYRDAKFFDSECHGVKAHHAPVTGLNILIFKICTAEDQY